MEERKLITIVGPTASGKTTLAAHLAYRLGAEIISGDSRQVYRGMDIGTGKDLADYVVEGRPIPYHLIDIAEPGEKYNIFRFQQDFLDVYSSLCSRGCRAIFCGGSGLYVESVLDGYHLSPVPRNDELRERLQGRSLQELTAMLEDLKSRNHTRMHNTTDVDTAKRAIRAIEIETYNLEHPVPDREAPKMDTVVIGTYVDRETRRQKITQRLRQRLEEGMVDEIRTLLTKVSAEELIYYGLEYKYVTEYVTGQRTYDEMFSLLEIAIHQFAKRQMTWFRGMERRGFNIHWVDASLPIGRRVDEALRIVENR